MNLGKPKMRRIVTPLQDAPVADTAYDDEGHSAPVTGPSPVPAPAAEAKPPVGEQPATAG